MVAEAMSEDSSLSMNAAVKRIGPRMGVVPDTLRGWVKQADIDAGRRPGRSTEEAEQLREPVLLQRAAAEVLGRFRERDPGRTYDLRTNTHETLVDVQPGQKTKFTFNRFRPQSVEPFESVEL